MRRYQKKLVKDAADLYQSDSPLRWVFIAQKLGSPRPMSEREQRLLARMVVRATKKVADTATEVIKQFGITMAEASRNMRRFANAIAVAKGYTPHKVVDLNNKTICTCNKPKTMKHHAASCALYEEVK